MEENLPFLDALFKAIYANKATFALFATCFAVMFTATALWGDVPTGLTQIGWNYQFLVASPYMVANDGPQAALGFIDALFLHRHWLHFTVCITGLFLFGVSLEQQIGWKKLLFLFIAGGALGEVGASIISLTPWGDEPFEKFKQIGSSPAVYAFLGAYIVALYRQVIKLRVDPVVITAGLLIGDLSSKIYEKAWFVFAAPSTAAHPQAFYSHFFGLVFGVLLGLWFVPRAVKAGALV
jgi:membrane associated rhomboid family serine protease